MFRLTKWVALLAFGFVFFEVVAGKKTGNLKLAAKAFQPRTAAFRRSNITGFSGEGTFVAVEDPDGAQRMAKVGRGVLR